VAELHICPASHTLGHSDTGAFEFTPGTARNVLFQPPAFEQASSMRLRSRLLSSCLALALTTVVANVSHAQRAIFSGVVLIDASEKPLAGAEISLTALNRSTRSDSAGIFVFTGLPAGRQRIVVRLPGYEPISTDIVLQEDKPLEVDLSLRPATTQLATLEVKAATSPHAWRLVDFEDRRKMGIGKFLTQEEIAKEGGRPLSSFLLKKIAGLRILQLNGERFLASSRGGGASGNKSPSGPSARFKNFPAACYLQIVINGRIEYNGTDGQDPYDVDRLNSLDIIGFELYTTAQTPVQYNMTRGSAGGPCGTAIIWTK
jgi:hypothetical protein